jgi:hypothetical protein
MGYASTKDLNVPQEAVYARGWFHKTLNHMPEQ